jgi:hypothetical protein
LLRNSLKKQAVGADLQQPPKFKFKIKKFITLMVVFYQKLSQERSVGVEFTTAVIF